MLFIFSIIAAIALVIAAFRVAAPMVRLGAFVGAAFLAAVAITQVFTVISAGHVGVIDVFGKVSETTLKPGVNIVNPFARIIEFSVKTQELKEVAEVPSREGLSVGLELSVLYHLNPDMADDVYRTVGVDYVDVLLVPIFRSVTRGVTAEYDAKALYTSERELLARKIEQELIKRVKPRGLEIEGAPLRKVSLPAKLTDAIEEKLRSEQESQRMEFVLTKEKQEADRKRIEAQGISDFQAIISQGLNENVLRWKGIEATELLARSNNAKVVIVGGGGSGLPLILGSQ